MTYSDKLVDHCTNPRNVGSLDSSSDLVGTGIVGVPACGDVMKVQIQVDENTPGDAAREVAVSQTIDVRRFAGQEMVFECDLMAERAKYGAPVTIELEQYRDDGSRIREYAVQPRWLTVELAEGHFVQFCERGRLSHEAATVNVRVRMQLYVRDADTGKRVAGPESLFAVWLDRVVVRPGERWPWPALTTAGFVTGGLERAPLNRAFEFTGQRRLAFSGASEGTLTANSYGDARSVHWGLEAGTLASPETITVKLDTGNLLLEAFRRADLEAARRRLPAPEAVLSLASGAAQRASALRLTSEERLVLRALGEAAAGRIWSAAPSSTAIS